MASHHPQPTLNKQNHLPQGRITEWSLKLTSTLLRHCPIPVWQQQRLLKSTEMPAKGCHKLQAWPCCTQTDHLACPGGDPTFTGLKMMLLLAGTSPSLGHRVAVVAQDLKTFLNALHWSRCHTWPHPGVYQRVRCINPDQKSSATATPEMILSHSSLIELTWL